MSKPIDDLEHEVAKESVRHEKTVEKAGRILDRFRAGNEAQRQLLESYAEADAAVNKKHKKASSIMARYVAGNAAQGKLLDDYTEAHEDEKGQK